MTVYPQDAIYFGFPVDPRDSRLANFDIFELAEYLVALIEAHHLLFAKMSPPAEYDKLEICRTREGKIFKEIALRAYEVTNGGGDRAALKDALARIADSQRDRLRSLAYLAPVDWRVRGEW